MAEASGAKVPTHLGLILDGNRRWARAQGRPQLEGHREGYKNLHTIVKHAFARGVKFVSAYVFSTENWNRTKEEVDYLMDLLVWVATVEIKKYKNENYRVMVIGSRERLSKKVLDAIEYAEEQTKDKTGGVVALCLNYGGKLEIADAVRSMMKAGMTADDMTPEAIDQHLYAPELPPVDMIIRTSGEQRLSNFMLWRAAYSELKFVPMPWPAFTTGDLDEALEDFANRQRRFGN